MYIIKFILSLILGFTIGFGLWYLILWFITSEPNLFVWHWAVKTVYLLFGFSSATGIIDGLLKELE